MDKSKIAAQMYSVRKELAADPDKTFRELKDIGFQAVQIDGFRGHEAAEIQQLVVKYGFRIAGMHIHHRRFFDDLDGLIQEALLFDCEILFDKYIDDEEQNEAGYRATKKQLFHVQDVLRNLGFVIGLHCPEYDYPNQVDGAKVLSYITKPKAGLSLIAEPDTYWMSVAGIDPVEEIKQYAWRAPIIHLKDYKKGFDPQDMDHNLVELGKGDVDFPAIVQWGEQNGVQYYCVEQDYSHIGMFNSMRESFDYLTSL